MRSIIELLRFIFIVAPICLALGIVACFARLAVAKHQKQRTRQNSTNHRQQRTNAAQDIEFSRQNTQPYPSVKPNVSSNTVVSESGDSR